jgi:hypothetical protein
MYFYLNFRGKRSDKKPNDELTSDISIKNKHFELELDTINVLEKIGWKYQFQIGMKMNRFIGLDVEKIVNRVYDENKNSYIKVEPVLVFKKE